MGLYILVFFVLGDGLVSISYLGSVVIEVTDFALDTIRAEIIVVFFDEFCLNVVLSHKGLYELYFFIKDHHFITLKAL
jgi:hypothetical protein